MTRHVNVCSVPLPDTLYRGERRLRMALVGLPNAGKTTLFDTVAGTFVRAGELTGTHRLYKECRVQVGLDEVSLLDLPSIECFHHLRHEDRAALQYLLWGDERPPVAAHEAAEPPAPFAPPELIIQVIDATALESHLELTLELAQLGRPMVIALNRMDEARAKGVSINSASLSALVGVRVVETTATTGHGIWELFDTAVQTVRDDTCPLPQPPSEYLMRALQPLSRALNDRDIHRAFRVPHLFLLLQVAAGDPFFLGEVAEHFPDRLPGLMRLRHGAEHPLPRPLAEEIHADRHHRAATLFEKVTRLGGPYGRGSWQYWLDELLLDTRWGLLGSLTVFALILFAVFEVSARLDAALITPLIAYAEQWQPASAPGVIGRAVADGLIGLAGIVIPYMLPLVGLLVALERAGISQRIAFVVDRGFQHIGLRGGVAASFLLGLGCNVPAIASVARATTGRDRIIATMLITFVPCSARSAIILALAGKYLGGIGVFSIFMATIVLIAVMGRALNRNRIPTRPGMIHQIPPFRRPRTGDVLAETWARTSDILVIVTPLLVGGSVVLALLEYAGANAFINTVLTPVTAWWLGVPVALGVPMLFGILRKELSLVMVYQALGTFDISQHMNWIQIATFLIFITFYVPCISTFAAMLKTVGRRYALYSVGLSVLVALAAGGATRWLLTIGAYPVL